MKDVNLDQLDLSKLSPEELQSLNSSMGTAPQGWHTGLFWAGLVIWGMSTVVPQQGLTLYALVDGGLKFVLFVAFTLWARQWSRLGAFLLLSWHLFSNRVLWNAAHLPMLLLFWGSTLGFLWIFIQCVGRRALIKKAQPDLT